MAFGTSKEDTRGMMNEMENGVTPIDVTSFIVLILFLLAILVIGMYYTLRNCRKLLHTIRQSGDTDNESDKDETTTTAVSTSEQIRQSSRASRRQLGEELQSMQQMQQNVALQLMEIKTALAHYKAIEQQQQQNGDHGTDARNSDSIPVDTHIGDKKQD